MRQSGGLSLAGQESGNTIIFIPEGNENATESPAGAYKREANEFDFCLFISTSMDITYGICTDYSR